MSKIAFCELGKTITVPYIFTHTGKTAMSKETMQVKTQTDVCHLRDSAKLFNSGRLNSIVNSKLRYTLSSSYAF